MIALEFAKKNITEKRKVAQKFRIKNLDGRQEAKISKIKEWCTKYLNDVEGTSYDFNAVIEALPDELLKIKSFLDSNYDIPQIMEELPHGKKYSYIETSLYTNIRNDAKKILLQNLNVTVCPYCNRNYIFSDENINTCELDHFIPKRKYPIFASSFYNLIPVCPHCNGKKGENEFIFYPHKPMKNTDDLIKFTYKILGSDYLTKLEDIDVELDVLDSDYVFQAKILKLEELYKYHKDSVQDVLKKRQIFSDAYLESLKKEFSTLFKTSIDVEELLYGVSLRKDDYGKRPLTKMIQDIVKEVNNT